MRPALLALLAAVAGVVVMSASIGGPFLFDDVLLIPHNHYVHDFSHWPRWLSGRLWDTNFDVAMQQTRSFWRPLVTASYAVDWRLGGGSPLTFHVTNLIVHAINSGLAFFVTSGWLRSRRGGLLAAVAFAVHPVQTEPVAWIAGRTDSLCLLGLLTVTLGVRLWPSRRALSAPLQAAGVVAAFAAKEMAVLLPILVTLELWSRERRGLTRSELLRLGRGVWPYALLSLTFALVHHATARVAATDAALTATNHLPLVLEACGRYVALLAWPDDLTMGRAMLRVDGAWYRPHLGYAALGAASVLGCLGAAARFRRRSPLLALGLMASLGSLLPVSGVVWLGHKALVAPRFLHVPLLFAALLAGMGLARARTRGATALAAAALVALGSRAALRAGDYGSAESFWRREIEANSHYPPAQEYFLARELQASRPTTALRLAHAWYPSPPDVPEWFQEKLIIKMLASLLARTPDLDRSTLSRLQAFAERLVDGGTAILELPRHGVRLEVSGQSRLRDRLLIEERTLRIMAAEAAVRLGDDDHALRQIERSLVGCENCWPLLSNAALLTAQAGRTERALGLARRARALAPPGKLEGLLAQLELANAWHRRVEASPTEVTRAGFYAAVGCHGRAYGAARTALSSPPPDPAARAALAEIAYQAGDVQRARGLLTPGRSPAQLEQTLAQLGRRARWRDREPGAPRWLPPGLVANGQRPANQRKERAAVRTNAPDAARAER